jgi:hypothetical protein
MHEITFFFQVRKKCTDGFTECVQVTLKCHCAKWRRPSFIFSRTKTKVHGGLSGSYNWLGTSELEQTKLVHSQWLLMLCRGSWMLPSRYQVYIATYVSVELSSDSYVVLYIRLPSTSGEFNHASVRTFFFCFWTSSTRLPTIFLTLTWSCTWSTWKIDWWVDPEKTFPTAESGWVKYCSSSPLGVWGSWPMHGRLRNYL